MQTAHCIILFMAIAVVVATQSPVPYRQGSNLEIYGFGLLRSPVTPCLTGAVILRPHTVCGTV